VLAYYDPLELLRARGVYDLGLKPPSSKERFDEKCHRVVARYLTLLEHHAPDVIDGSASLFDETTFGPGGGKLKAPPRT